MTREEFEKDIEGKDTKMSIITNATLAGLMSVLIKNKIIDEKELDEEVNKMKDIIIEEVLNKINKEREGKL